MAVWSLGGDDFVPGEKVVFGLELVCPLVDFLATREGYGLEARYFELGLAEDEDFGLVNALPGFGIAGDDLLFSIIS